MADSAKDFDVLDKPKDAWKAVVSPEAFTVLFHEGTERAWQRPGA